MQSIVGNENKNNYIRKLDTWYKSNYLKNGLYAIMLLLFFVFNGCCPKPTPRNVTVKVELDEVSNPKPASPIEFEVDTADVTKTITVQVQKPVSYTNCTETEPMFPSELVIKTDTAIKFIEGNLKGGGEITKNDTNYHKGKDSTIKHPIDTTPLTTRGIDTTYSLKSDTNTIGGKKDWILGAKVGPMFSKMLTSQICDDCHFPTNEVEVSKLATWNTTPLFSIFSKFKIIDNVFLMPELLFNTYSLKLDDPTLVGEYEFNLSYINIRPNIGLAFLLNSDTINPFNLNFHVAPNFGVALRESYTKGNLNDETQIRPINADSINTYDIGFNVGLGISKMFNRLEIGLDLSYSHGFINNNRITRQENNFYRYNRGFEVALSLGWALSTTPLQTTIIDTVKHYIDTLKTITIVEKIETFRVDTIKILKEISKGTRIDIEEQKITETIMITEHLRDTCYIAGGKPVIEYKEIPVTSWRDTCSPCPDCIPCISCDSLDRYELIQVCNKAICVPGEFFELDESKLPDSITSMLDKVISFLRKPDNRNIYIQIYGHTDSAGVPPYIDKNVIKNNDSLSFARAKETEAYIIKNAPELYGRIGLVKGVASAYPQDTTSYQQKNHPSYRRGKQLPDSIRIEQTKKLESIGINRNLQRGENLRNRRIEIMFRCNADESKIDHYPTENDNKDKKDKNPKKIENNNSGGK